MKKNLWIVCLLVIVIVSGTAQGVSSTFTSTADFDAGTYTASAGNRELNSNGCNPGIVADAFELDSLKGDSFCLDDADANTFKWDLSTNVGCGGAPVITRVIAAGVLTIAVASDIGACRTGVRSASLISGNWDLRVFQDRGSVVGADFQKVWEIAMFNEPVTDCGESGTVDGVHYFIPRSALIGAAQLSARTCLNGAETVVGSNTDEPGDPQYYRMTRSGDTFSWMYSPDGLAWVTDETSVTVGLGTAWYATIIVFANGNLITMSANYDDYHQAAGTLSASGYRASGSWTSATQSSDGTEAEVTVTYSGATATAYIDYVAIYDGITEIAVDNTNIVGGTTITYTFVVDIPAGWTVRIGLAGNGAGTATVESVSVTIPDPPECFGTSIFGSILFAIFGTIAGVALVAAIMHGLRAE